jgi:hypothetical protein
MQLLGNTILTPHPATLASFIGFDCICAHGHRQDEKLSMNPFFNSLCGKTGSHNKQKAA